MARDDLALRHILVPLTRSMHFKPRGAIARRYEAMVRELQFVDQHASREMPVLRQNGWTDLRLRTLFVLNSFYQEYLGPLHASAQGHALELGTTVPIAHGSLQFDGRHRADVIRAVTEFHRLVDAAKMKKSWLSLNTCGDLIYWIARSIREEQNERDRGETQS